MDLSDCETVDHVHAYLMAYLCTEYLHEESCKTEFDIFKLKCAKYLKTPVRKDLLKASDLWEKLESKGHLRAGQYDILRELTKDVHADIEELIHEAEEKIQSLTSTDRNTISQQQLTNPSAKKRKYSGDVINIHNEDKNTTSQQQLTNPSSKKRKYSGDDVDILNEEPKLKVICFLKTQIEDENNDEGYPIESIANKCLEYILRDCRSIRARGNVTVDEFHESYPLMVRTTSRLLEECKTLFAGIEGNKKQLAKSLALSYLEMFVEHFVLGTFKEFCEQKADRFFAFLIESANGIKNLMTHCDATTESLRTGSVIWSIVFNTVVGLDRFWKYFFHGELQRFLEDLMNKKELLFLLGAKKICIALDISKEEYLRYRQFLGNRERNSEVENEKIDEKLNAIDHIRRFGKPQTKSQHEIGGRSHSTEVEDTDEDEPVSYDRLCSLIFFECPKLLRKIISQCYILQGIPDFMNFLEQKKHKFFHLVNTECCCGNNSSFTPISTSQFNLLFLRTSFRNPQGQTRACPCQYRVVYGVDINIMDITMCCIVLEYVCPEFALTEIHSILHALSNMFLAESYPLHENYMKTAWKNVKTAMLKLALGVSPQVYTNTRTSLRTLKSRIFSIKDFHPLKNISNSISKHSGEIILEVCNDGEADREYGKSTAYTCGSQLRSDVETTLELEGDIFETFPDFIKGTDQSDVRRLKNRLIKINNEITKATLISPLQAEENELSIELLYAETLIYEDHMHREKGRKSSQLISNVKGPEDIFLRNYAAVRNIYLLGDTARGKTTFCIWILKNWCDAQLVGKNRFDRWKIALKNFDFVFLFKFCNVNPGVASVSDMICQELFQNDQDCWDAIRHVLSSYKYRCLIIMDGLDKWNPNDTTKLQLMQKGLPNVEDLSSKVSCLYSMRPWIFSIISRHVKSSHKVLNIQGLSDAGKLQVVENLLLNHYELNRNSFDYTNTYNKMLEHLVVKSINSFMRIPLLAVVLIQLLYEGKLEVDSMTSFYTGMVDMLIERGNDKHKLQKEKDKSSIKNYELPESLSKYENIKNFKTGLLKLGKVAYEGLRYNTETFRNMKRALQKEICAKDFKFALDVRLISQEGKNAPFSFFHTSIEEFLAAMYIVVDEKVGCSLCDHLSNFEVIMEFSNVILFICGMCPSLGSVMLQHVAVVTDSDTAICQYRQSLALSINRVKELCNIQFRWYKELQCANKGSSVTCYISDVYLDGDKDIETVNVTRELLSDQHVLIRSLYLYKVSTDSESGITDTVLNNFLSDEHRTKSLVMVYIHGGKYGDGADDSDDEESDFDEDNKDEENSDCHEDFKEEDDTSSEHHYRYILPICIPTLRSLYLFNVAINDAYSGVNICHPLLKQMTSLRVLRLWSVNLGDRELGLCEDMVNIEEIKLYQVSMSTAGWKQFFRCLQSIQHTFVVGLYDTNIDYDSVEKIRSSPDFIVEHEYVKEGSFDRKYEIRFTRV